MGSKPRSTVWVTALAVGVFQVVGSYEAAENQPDRRAIDAAALVLVVLGPIALAWRDRWPLTAAAVTVGAADVYIARGYPYGPIFLGVVVALFTAVQAGDRRATWSVASAGYAGFVVASFGDPWNDGPTATHLALVAVGWWWCSRCRKWSATTCGSFRVRKGPMELDAAGAAPETTDAPETIDASEVWTGTAQRTRFGKSARRPPPAARRPPPAGGPARSLAHREACIANS